MDDRQAIEALAALAQETRLAAVRLLVRHAPDGLPAGEVARRLAVPQNTMSAHLAILTRVGLVRAERKGRSIMQRASLSRIGALVGFLLADCCGRGDLICSGAPGGIAALLAEEGASRDPAPHLAGGVPCR